MRTMDDNKKTSQEIDRFLKENPNLKKAMDVFGVSMKEYTKAINALTKKNVIITSNNTNGDLGRN